MAKRQQTSNPAPDPLEGIEFADGDPKPDADLPSNVIQHPTTLEQFRANERAVKQALVEMRNRPPPDYVPPEVQPATEEEIQDVKPKMYVVTREGVVHARGRQHVFRVGKIFSENEYDIASVRRQLGGALEEYQG